MAYTDWRTLVTDVTRHVNKTITESSVNNTLKVENDDLAGRKTIWIWKWDNHSWIHVMYLDSGMSVEQRTEVLRKLQSQSPTAYYKMSTTKPKNPPNAAAAAAKDKEDRTWRLSNLIQAIKDNW